MSFVSFDFDTIIDRRNTNSMAHEGFRGYLFGGQDPINLPCPDDEALSMWVADMAFASAPAAREAITEWVESSPILGYSSVFGSTLYDAFAGWCDRRYGWHPEQAEVIPTGGIVPALYAFAERYLQPGEAAITLTPAYGYFAKAPLERDREFVSCGLVARGDGTFEVDFDDFASKVADPNVKLFYLCYPHNPTGRSFTIEELTRFVELCEANDVLIISDEIHCDLLRVGLTHEPLAKLFPDNDRIITAMSTSKTFNLAGMGFAFVIIPNPELRQIWHEHAFILHNPISVAATVGVLTNGDPWRQGLREYLDMNFAYLEKRLGRSLPKAVFSIPDATYLAWIDLQEYFPKELNLTRYFAEAEGLLLEGGDMFVTDGDAHVRLNLACPLAMLTDGVNRLVSAIDSYQ